jgi:hypothetical protein
MRIGTSFIVLVVAVAGARCASRPATHSSEPRAVADAAPTAAPVSASPPVAPLASFATSVKPILARTCAPCHNPGGKMYASMPFDDANTVASHSEGILRRLKEPDDRKALEVWLSSGR